MSRPDLDAQRALFIADMESAGHANEMDLGWIGFAQMFADQLTRCAFMGWQAARTSKAPAAQQEVIGHVIDMNAGTGAPESLTILIPEKSNLPPPGTMVYAALASQVPAVQQEPYGWVQFIDGVQTQNFARFESELETLENMIRIRKVPGNVMYLPVYAAPSPQVNSDLPEDAMAQLMEAWDFGQFSDHFDQPQARPVRKAIRDLCEFINAARNSKS